MRGSVYLCGSEGWGSSSSERATSPQARAYFYGVRNTIGCCREAGPLTEARRSCVRSCSRRSCEFGRARRRREPTPAPASGLGEAPARRVGSYGDWSKQDLLRRAKQIGIKAALL